MTKLYKPTPRTLHQTLRGIAAGLESQLAQLVSVWSPLWKAHRTKHLARAKKEEANSRVQAYGGDHSIASTTRRSLREKSKSLPRNNGVGGGGRRVVKLQETVRKLLLSVVEAGFDIGVGRGQRLGAVHTQTLLEMEAF